MIPIIDLKIDPEFRDKIPPLTEAEFEQLKDNILTDGEVYEPICAWNGTIVDGHNRWKIIQEYPTIPFRVREMQFADKWEAFDWMYKKQLGRRNLTEEQKTYLLGKLYEARKKSSGGTGANRYTKGNLQDAQNGQAVKTTDKVNHGVSGEIAVELNIGRNTVRRAEHFAQGLDKAEEVMPGFRQKILSGEVKASKKDVANIRRLKDDKEVKSAIEEILNPKPKAGKNPNIPSKPRAKQTEEDQRIAERVGKIIEIQNDSNRDTSITIQDLAELVEEDGKDYVSSLRNMLTVRSTLLIGENRQVIAEVIENIINEIYKVKELLK